MRNVNNKNTKNKNKVVKNTTDNKISKDTSKKKDLSKTKLVNKVIDNFSTFPNKDSKDVKDLVLEPVKDKIKVDKKTVNNEKKNINKENVKIKIDKKVKVDKKYKEEYVYDDGLDGIYTDRIVDILSNRKIVLVISIIGFILVCIVVGKAFYYGKKNHHYEEYFVKIKERNEELTKIHEPKEIDINKLKNVAASEYVNCINSSVDMNNLSNELKSVIDDINKYYKKSNNYFAFKYEDIYTGFSVSYNEKQGIFAASTIKAPTDIYLWEMIRDGNINIDDTLTYTRNYYDYGTGVLKDKQYNTNYTVRELLNYSIVYSDNAAHNMLMDRYGKNNMLNFWNNLGTDMLFKSSTNWGYISAHDAAIYMRELYNYYVDTPEYGEMAMSDFLNSEPKLLNSYGYKMANKYGWSGSSIHDVAIIFADNPYILIALSNLGDKKYDEYFEKASEFGKRLHTEYWKYKMNLCSNIKQY